MRVSTTELCRVAITAAAFVICRPDNVVVAAAVVEVVGRRVVIFAVVVGCTVVVGFTDVVGPLEETAPNACGSNNDTQFFESLSQK